MYAKAVVILPNLSDRTQIGDIVVAKNVVFL